MVLDEHQRGSREELGFLHVERPTMNRGVLGTGPDGNNRKRSDTQAAYISSMMHGNPKLLLAESPLFKGLTQHQLPFTVHPIKASSCVQYQARIRLAFPVNLLSRFIPSRSRHGVLIYRKFTFIVCLSHRLKSILARESH